MQDALISISLILLMVIVVYLRFRIAARLHRPFGVPSDAKDPNWRKVGDGWEYRSDLGDGSGVQVLQGRSKQEVTARLEQARESVAQKLRNTSGRTN